ncbi:Rv3654c family TadE-like protein [Branchiibius sp. NY16-3462-2]|uniref:Rv3654c family TadE-like protein n=1 Tax=Branchiibius sp. NY16-3462-2 TaxID=1807500 RepID=UPI0007986151|nr:Rv3654c family TadE-like protein [Branchiibius sp. NY16-3462-2]KYH42879.1 hypothetical protein AZH51_00430 [Branchiibius sp. NY16-3462-2]
MSGRERGSATVLAVGVIAVLILLLGGALTVARVVRAAGQAAAAADMAALAGARVLQTSSAPAACAAAGRSVSGNGAVLVSCAAQGQDLLVQVSVATGVPGAGQAAARARAGPAEARTVR